MTEPEERRAPVDIVGIGVSKAASGWIYTCLNEHPQICGSRPKEADYFHKHHERGRGWYERCFAHCPRGTLRLEYSPGYFRFPDAVEHIKREAPQAKLITCLRNPIERLQSSFTFNRERGAYNYATIEEALRDRGEGFVRKSRYADDLAMWQSAFPPENILVLFYEDIAQDPLAFIQRIYAFVGVDAAFVPPSATRKVNATRTKWRFRSLNRAILTTRKTLKRNPLGKRLVRVLHALGLGRVLRFILSLNITTDAKPVAKPALAPETEARLYALLKDDIDKLEAMTGRDLSAWRI